MPVSQNPVHELHGEPKRPGHEVAQGNTLKSSGAQPKNSGAQPKGSSMQPTTNAAGPGGSALKAGPSKVRGTTLGATHNEAAQITTARHPQSSTE